MKIGEEKTPMNIDRFGNTSGASIPLLMVTELREKLQTHRLRHLACGFGVGLSLGSACFVTNQIVVPELIEVSQ
jgi:3-oxoacyl-[acyl-carrier-protein] synthase-3